MKILIAWILIFSSAWASASEYGVFLGNLLPDGPEGVKEIMGVGGLRYGRMQSEDTAYEVGILVGAQAPVTWQNLFADMRHDMQVEGLLTHVGFGLDVIHFTTKLAQIDDNSLPILDSSGQQVYREDNKLAFGAHVMGGVQERISGPMWLRADMKFNFIPALILTITASIEMRYGSEPKETPK